MARKKIEIPTDEALSKAQNALTDLASRKPLTAIEKIWSVVGQQIMEARKAGHGWDDISAALASAGITVSATTLRMSAPKEPQKRQRKAKTDKGSEKPATEDSVQ